MAITHEDILEIVEMLESASEFGPIVEKVIDSLMDYGDQIRRIPDALHDYMVEMRIKRIHKYEEAGFCRNDAIMMAMDDATVLSNFVQNFNTKSPQKTRKPK